MFIRVEETRTMLVEVVADTEEEAVEKIENLYFEEALDFSYANSELDCQDATSDCLFKMRRGEPISRLVI